MQGASKQSITQAEAEAEAETESCAPDSFKPEDDGQWDAPGAHTLAPEILREYDIRGEVDRTLSKRDAYIVGKAFGTMIRHRGGSRVALGYDGRISSPELTEAVCTGLLTTGVRVDRIGVGPTPMLYFTVKDQMEDGGIMVTGSHNPPGYNGFKMTLQNTPLFGESIQEIGRIAANGSFVEEPESGKVRDSDVIDTYVDRLMRDFKGERALKVAWDPGNGAAGEVLHKLARRLPGEHILLNDEIDGTFPNHHPDPSKDENLEDLKRLVLEQGCDLGIALDGDADRIGVVDETGRIIRCDMLICLYARQILNELEEAPIIADVKCSQALFDEIRNQGGHAVMWKTGHSLIKDKMAELKAPLAGELSGHIFFADKYYGYDDGLYCAIRLLNILNESDAGTTDDNDAEDGESTTLSQMLADMPHIYNTPEIRLEVEEAHKFNNVDKVLQDQKARAENEEARDIVDIDGIRVITEDGWWLLRASNTQNVLVVRAEAHSLEALDRVKQDLNNALIPIGREISFTTEST
jgi:phosphomannomutase